MKKICYWSPHLSNVATIKNVINSAISLKKFTKKGINIKIFNVIGEWSDYKKLFASHNIDIIEFSNFKLTRFYPITGFLKSRLVYFLVFFFKTIQLKKILKKENPDFLIIHLITIIPLFLLIFFKFNTKFVLRISGLPKLTILRKFLWKFVSNKVFLITCPSEQTKKDLEKLNIFPKNKLKILYDPIIKVDDIMQQLKQANHLNLKEKKYLLNIGRLTNQKNHMLLLKAFLEISKTNSELLLYIIGAGENKKKIQSFIELNNLQKNIFLLGHLNNVFPIIKNSLAVISTSLWEDPGAVMVEASYCNKNVISSNCPNGPEEFLSNGKGGYLFQNKNKKDLVDKIKLFLNENEKDRFSKILLCKKKVKNYTLFQHYKNFSFLLNLS